MRFRVGTCVHVFPLGKWGKESGLPVRANPDVDHLELVVDSTEEQLSAVERLPATRISIHGLRTDDSVRRAGENDEHIRVLAAIDAELPPILVHQPTWRVIDGLHRVQAAIMRGHDTIVARFFDGTLDDAFVLSIRLNTTHGLPLTHSDRTLAAQRIVASHPHWSNRKIAAATGLAAGTIEALRRRSTAQNGQSIVRIGKDGRVRPIDGFARRQRVCELLRADPDASIRTIAKAAGVSPSTVHDVRKRLRAGEDPTVRRTHGRARQATVRSLPESGDEVDLSATMSDLVRDPSLRLSEGGRRVIRWLEGGKRVVADGKDVVDHVPQHCTPTVAKLAREYARLWAELATHLEHNTGRGATA